jgi:hypothetical protein
VKRRIAVGTLLSILIVVSTSAISGAANPNAGSSVPRELRKLILNTLGSPNLRIDDFSQSIGQSWDYQSPNRGESFPRRFLASHHDYGFEIDVGDIVVYHFSVGRLKPGAGYKVVGNSKFIGVRISNGSKRWTNVQGYLFAPLIDALDGNRFTRSEGTYRFSTRSGIRGSVTVNGRRVVSAEIVFKSTCSGRSSFYHESELFYGIEHYEKVVAPPSSVIQYAKPGKLTSETTAVCS